MAVNWPLKKGKPSDEFSSSDAFPFRQIAVEKFLKGIRPIFLKSGFYFSRSEIVPDTFRLCYSIFLFSYYSTSLKSFGEFMLCRFPLTNFHCPHTHTSPPHKEKKQQTSTRLDTSTSIVRCSRARYIFFLFIWESGGWFYCRFWRYEYL